MSEVSQVVAKVASATLSGVDLSRVVSEPTTTFDGDEALHVTIVLRGTNLERLTGHAAIDTLVGIVKSLQTSGDDRFPIIDYTTEEELEQDDSPES